ncbi:hypothetical protein HanIR_Chr05g0213431 [Helianthus annuus]|nr:hypothetical protein HanIR_Chr05g0213431 [Helianthus annuus]
MLITYNIDKPLYILFLVLCRLKMKISKKKKKKKKKKQEASIFVIGGMFYEGNSLDATR